jgi:V8-like Glu-specific endopeptidase
MRATLFAALFTVFSAPFVVAEDADLHSLDTADESRGWEAVGRLDIEGKGFCTGALISETLVLTAAHCVYNADGTIIDADSFQFLAGLRNGSAQAYRGVRRLVAHPDYVHDVGGVRPERVSHDLALLELNQAIRTSRITPFDTDTRPNAGDPVGVVSYAHNRTETPSLQEVCEVLGRQSGVLIMTCDVDFGSSGAPVFTMQGGRARIVSVVSAMADIDDRKVSLGTSLAAPLEELRAHFASVGPARPGGTQRLIMSGERNDTGAKFLRP